MKRINVVFISLVGMVVVSASCFAGWTDFFSSSKKEGPKALSASEKSKMPAKICNCAVGSIGQYAETTADAEYEQRIRPLMKKLEESLTKDYYPGMQMNCSGGSYAMVPGARKVCRAAYLTYGTNRELKEELQELMH